MGDDIRVGTPLTFRDEYFAGRATACDLDDAIEAWHEGAGAGLPLHEFLGLTFGQYAHWVETSELPERCTISADCLFAKHEAQEHPCGKPHRVGDPCQFCGDPLQRGPGGGAAPCPKCWTPIPDNLADAKALLALGGLSLDPQL